MKLQKTPKEDIIYQFGAFLSTVEYCWLVQIKEEIALSWFKARTMPVCANSFAKIPLTIFASKIDNRSLNNSTALTEPPPILASN